MKLYCPLSGIAYTCNIGYGHGKVPHPVFSLPIKSLIKGQLEAAIAGDLSQDETHLFGCALLRKLPILWDTALLPEYWKDHWPAIIEQLATVALRYDSRRQSDLPAFRLTAETATLNNLKTFLREFDSAISDINANIATSFIKDRAEEVILRILRSALSSNNQKYNKLPKLMADWAKAVGHFPKTSIPINESISMPLADYWHGIIRRSFEAQNPVEILSDTVSLSDIEELLEHCEEYIEYGSIHSIALFKKLRTAREILAEFRPEKISTSSGSITADLLGGETSPVEKVYIEGEPRRESFSSTMAYIKAKRLWNTEQEN